MSVRKYTIEEYNPEWAKKFQEIKLVLEKIFKDKFTVIEHVGSTSIPGLKAKPLIDVLAIVEHWEDFEKEKSEMTKLGYQFRSHTFDQNSLLFEKILNNEKIENIHVLVKGAKKINEFLNVRDYLRSNPDKAHEYEALKEELVAKYPNDYVAYREEKSQFLLELNNLAREWRETEMKKAHQSSGEPQYR
jgi:GrpB-like predicted nucleotidyltransferase (UPF0157 family)